MGHISICAVQDIKAALGGLGITQANPAFNLLAKTGAQVMMLRDYISANMNKTSKTAAIAQDKRRAGPTGAATSGSGGAQTSAGDEDVMASFSKLRTRTYYDR